MGVGIVDVPEKVKLIQHVREKVKLIEHVPEQTVVGMVHHYTHTLSYRMCSLTIENVFSYYRGMVHHSTHSTPPKLNAFNQN